MKKTEPIKKYQGHYPFNFNNPFKNESPKWFPNQFKYILEDL